MARMSIGDAHPRANTAIKLPPILAYIVGAEMAPRFVVENLIQKAIEALDELDDDADREDDDPAEDDNEDRCLSRDDDLTFRYDDGGAGDPDEAEDEHDREQCY